MAKKIIGSDERKYTDITKIESSIINVRNRRVILDNDLADLYGVQTKRHNEQVRRNAERFGEKYAFQISKNEFAGLRSQFATSKTGRGGRRYPPWVFTEYGVVMAATILDSDKAVEASKFIVDVFVEVKNRFDQKNSFSSRKELRKDEIETSLDQLPWIIPGPGGRLQEALRHVLD